MITMSQAMIKQTAEQKKREQILDEDWISDIAFVFNNIHSCEELTEIWDEKWMQCPHCGASVSETGIVIHVKQ